MASDSCFRNQINGSMVAQYQGRNVSVIGKVINTNPNGLSFEIRTGDDMIVNVTMQRPLTEPISELIEVKGKCQGRMNILCDSYIMFPSDLAKTFDAAMDNEAVILCNSIANPWK
ncbi:replication protein A 14 kDa subunit-like [Lycorma delicatula]|uniref:replication protein A 14 kDa subunit-like n=1 Tax=Lycorma delicatula TaxID=130591 RepID=UPI003F50E60F